MAGKKVNVTARWTGALRFEAASEAGAAVRMDSLPGASASTPMELALMALAGCTGMDVVDILAKKRQPAESIEIRVSGARAEDHPRVYTEIDLEYILSGKALTPEAVARSIELSITKYCSVGGMLAKTAAIRTSFRIVPPEETPHE